MSPKGTCIVNAYCQFSQQVCTNFMQIYLYSLISTRFFILTTNLHWQMTNPKTQNKKKWFRKLSFYFRAIAISCILVTVVYVLTNVAFYTTLSVPEVLVCTTHHMFSRILNFLFVIVFSMKITVILTFYNLFLFLEQKSISKASNRSKQTTYFMKKFQVSYKTFTEN